MSRGCFSGVALADAVSSRGWCACLTVWVWWFVSGFLGLRSLAVSRDFHFFQFFSRFLGPGVRDSCENSFSLGWFMIGNAWMDWQFHTSPVFVLGSRAASMDKRG